MKNRDLARDYIERSGHRLAAVELLFERKGYADVVRESQELVELCLKGLLRIARVEVPRIHDVGALLVDAKGRLPAAVKPHVDALARISKEMRRDRELAFYGSEDLTPSDFYQVEDAKKALDDARWVHSICHTALGEK
ncbi:MAG: HEPN domain-containing protein [Pseudomonadota bacterium]